MACASSTDRDEWIRALERVICQLAERRGHRSVSLDCTGSSLSSTSSISGRQYLHELPAAVSSLNYKRNGPSSGSQPDLPSQHTSTVLN